MQFIWVYLDDMMGKGLDLGIIFQLLIYASARIVNMALPLAILMSSIMTLGALSEHNELTAMKSAGMSLTRIFRPLTLFILMVSIGAFVFANNAWPIANLKFRTLLFSIIQQKPTLNLTEGVFYNGIEGISLRVTSRNAETGEMKDVILYDHRESNKGNKHVIRAESGSMLQTEDKRWLIVSLKNGVSYDEMEEENRQADQNFPALHSEFKEMTLRIDLSSLIFKQDDEEVFQNAFEMMTIPQLDMAIMQLDHEQDSIEKIIHQEHLNYTHWKNSSAIASNQSLFTHMPIQYKQKAQAMALDATRREINSLVRNKSELEDIKKFESKHKIEWHRKFFLGVSCLVLFFIGAPLGAIIRKGGLGLPSVIALMLFILFEILTMLGEKMAKALFWEPWVGMWLSTAVLMPISIWLTYLAQKEKRWTSPVWWSWIAVKLKKKASA
jgi:lipopolysaccharide export system permease protein